MPTPSNPSIPQLEANFLTSSQLFEIYANLKEDVNPNRINVYGRDQLGFQEVMNTLGQTREIKSNVLSHIEQDWRDSVIRVTDSYTPAGATATFTVNASYNFSYPPSGQSIYTSAVTAYGVTPRVGDVLDMAGIHVRVETVTAGATSTFAVVCTQSGEVVPDGLENVEIFKIGRMEAEGGSTPINQETRDVYYQNKLHTIMEGYKSTGTTLLQEGFINTTNGKPYYFEQGILDTRFRFEDAVDSVLFTGKKVTSTNAAFSNINATEGLIPFIQNYGNQQGYTENAFSLSDFKTMSLTLGKFQGSDTNMLILSQSLKGQIDDLLRTSPGLLAGGVSYDKMADLGFKELSYYGVNYMFKTIRAFSNPNNFGSADSLYKNMGLVVPMGNTTAFDLGGEKINRPAIELCYANAQGSGEVNGFGEWITGGRAERPTDDTDTRKINMIKRAAFQAYGPKRYGLFEVEA